MARITFRSMTMPMMGQEKMPTSMPMDESMRAMMRQMMTSDRDMGMDGEALRRLIDMLTKKRRGMV